MAKLDFYGPDLKTERAEYHIDELERIFDQYVRKNRNLFHKKTQPITWRETVVLCGEFPRHTPTLIGDAIHNLRASLDHAYCILIEANGHTVSRYSMFPFNRDRASVLAAIKSNIADRHGPCAEIMEVIVDRIQPYQGGAGERLYGLHQLDILDKHVVLIPTVSSLRISGYVGTTDSGSKVRGDLRLHSIGPQVQKDGLLTLGPGIRFEAEKNPVTSFDISFKADQPFGGGGITATLHELLSLTRKALADLFEAAHGIR